MNESHGRGEQRDDLRRRKVSYFYENNIGNYHYGPGHPMKPHRLALTHALVNAYGLVDMMDMYRPHAASPQELMMFHSPEYIKFLERVTPEIAASAKEEADIVRYNLMSDSPVFPGIYDFCRLYAGGSIDGARQLVSNQHDIVVNWAGGLHHAKRGEASGFCYINDIVLAILELLKQYARVLYIDIDVHHGDGVQEAFYNTDRVMTLSVHKYGDGFFPGTGASEEQGVQRGRRYSVNVPLDNGIDDAAYAYVFNPIVSKCFEVFRPGAVVLQCGADSLGCDRLGTFNLSIRGHSECVRFVRSFGVPLLILGGGGYTIRNVSRCWAYETSVILDQPVSNELPRNTPYYEFYAPDYQLHPALYNMKQTRLENLNTRESLDRIKQRVIDQLHELRGAPSVQMHTIPILGDYESDASISFDHLLVKDSITPLATRPSLMKDLSG